MFRVIGAESEQLHFFVGSEDCVKYPECQDNMSRDGRREGFSRVGPLRMFSRMPAPKSWRGNSIMGESA
jgi:hypothetical protein